MTGTGFASLLRAGGLALALAVLPGCLSIGGDSKVTMYSPDIAVAPAADWPAVTWPLVVARPSASDALDTTRIVVRPQPDQLQVYKGAVWSDPAPELVQAALVRAFEDSGKVVAVARRSSGIRGDFTLAIDMRHFEAVYAAGADAPQVLVEFQAALLSTPGNRVLATRTFRQEVAAANAKVPAVMAAFDGALTATLSDVVGWTLVSGQANAQNAAPGR